MSCGGIDPRSGTQLLGYRIEELLGRGGMGVVYRAERLGLGRKVALKLLAPELAENESFRRRFSHESRMAAPGAPNILPIYDAGEADGLLWTVMRYVQGWDLNGLLEREGGFPAGMVVATAPRAGWAAGTALVRPRPVGRCTSTAGLAVLGVVAAANLVFAGLSTLTFLDIPGPALVAAVEVAAASSLVMLLSVLLAPVARQSPPDRSSDLGLGMGARATRA